MERGAGFAAFSPKESIPMRILAQQQPESPRPESPPRDLARLLVGTIIRRGHVPFGTRAAFFVSPLLLSAALAAQTPQAQAPAATPPTAHRAVHTHRKPSPAKPAAQPVAALATPAPPAPQIPDWPANNKPADASVVWNSHGLFIQAANSSLDQILKEVSLKTGAQVEGMGADERIFGIYGPGAARDVLSQLLDGSGYNVLMVGDKGEGAPLRVVLSGRPSGQAQPAGNGTESQSDSQNDQDVQQISEQEPPQPGEQPRPGTPEYNAAQPVPMRTPQQFMQQMQQMRQLQQQQPPQNNPQNPQ
jgi:hypothetical protein